MGGRKAPIIAGAASAAVVLVAVLLLVFPKRDQVSTARGLLEDEKARTAQLQTELQTLQEAKANAPRSRAEIRKVETEVPPTVDLPGLILTLKAAQERAGVDFSDIAVSNPTVSTIGGFSAIPVTITLDGTYFSLAEFALRIESLSRAAKVLTASISPQTGGSTLVPLLNELTMEMSLEVYTSDTSAGPGSAPAPAGSAGA
jgi:Tfp pilus assembly protein PilO